MVTNENTANSTRAGTSAFQFSKHRPNIANPTPQVAVFTTRTSPICPHPGFTAISERVKIAKVMSVIGRQILSASSMVRMNDALAMRAATAAVSEVGGESSPQTDRKNTKKRATQGLMTRLTIGGTMITAPTM